MPFSRGKPLPSFGSLIRVAEPEHREEKSARRPKSKLVKNMTHLHSRCRSQPDADEAQEENGVLFWVNKSGFPIDERTWQRMWNHVTKIHPDGQNMTHKIQYSTGLPQVPIPQPPLSFSPTLAIGERMEKIQTYMRELQYNHTGTQFFEIKKNRPISGLMECAKEMIREALPIKCLEAVILGIYLTNGMMGVERYPISFKSIFNGCVHRHVVLGVYHGGRYGTLGMSRRDDLMYKPMVYKSLSDLIFDFEKAYKKYWHDVKKIKVGLPCPHDPHSYEVIHWKSLTLNVPKLTLKEMQKDLEQHSKEIRAKAKSWIMPPNLSKKMATFVDTYKESASSGKSVPVIKLARSQTSMMDHKSAGPHTVKKKTTVQDNASEYQIRI